MGLLDYRWLLALCMFTLACKTNTEHKNSSILVFSKTAGYHHSCIENGTLAIMKLANAHNISVDTTTNPSIFAQSNLSEYDAIVFFNTTGDVLNSEEEKGFQKFIQSGKGYVGIHSASDTEYKWGWYGNLVGAYFVSHPKIQEATYTNVNSKFPGLEKIPSKWVRTDEIYNFNIVNKDVNVILTVDESSYEGGTNGAFHPIAWYHDYDGGRAFYTALGHTHESYTEPLFLNHVLGGIKYAIGSEHPN